MKIAICGDVHWNQYSSILRKRGDIFSVRLENLINSVNWFNKLAEDNNCRSMFFVGDFFDKAELNAEEISALKQIEWPNMPTYFLCGNHEMQSFNHKYSSAKIFDLLSNGTVIDKPTQLKFNDLDICLLPYILESDRKDLAEYFSKPMTKRLILSHNDIAGIQMGKFISEAGFTIDEISENCNLFINGHLHNGEKITDKIINIGILSGMNFSEDAEKYDHVAFILDTETLKVEVFENPFATNFYKLDYTTSIPSELKYKNNAVLTIKCKESDVDDLKYKLSNLKNVLEYRLVIQAEIKHADITEITESLTVDHLKAFYNYMIDNVENSQELLDELNEVLK